MTSEECSLLIAIPIFDVNESENAVVEEICRRIADKRQCIPQNELDGVIIGMYLNIVEYIDLDKQQELMELIEVNEKSKGVIAKFKRECREEGEKRIIRRLLDKNSVSTVAVLLDMSEADIINIMND